jgi:hypothetical protein
LDLPTEPVCVLVLIFKAITFWYFVLAENIQGMKKRNAKREREIEWVQEQDQQLDSYQKKIKSQFSCCTWFFIFLSSSYLLIIYTQVLYPAAMRPSSIPMFFRSTTIE